MKLRFLSIMASFFLLTASVSAQTKKKKKEEKKETEAKENAAKADVLIQKDNIYDKDVLQNEIKPQGSEKMRTFHMRTRFHKRKLNHRLRRRRF